MSWNIILYLQYKKNVRYHRLTSRTAIPTALAKGLPPNVLKWSACESVAAILGVVTTAAIGKPLPIPFAIVTISGIIPWPSNPQKCSPVLPNPVWTSSETNNPPFLSTRSTACLR